MNIEIKEHCIRCGICSGIYKGFFEYNVKDDCMECSCTDFKDENIEIIKNAMADCPVTAIFIKK